MTILMQRKQTIEMFLLRLLLGLTVLLIVELFRREITDYTIFIILIFIFLLFPSLTEFTVFTDRVEFRKYFLLATITKSHILSADNRPDISNFEIEMPSPSMFFTFCHRAFFNSILLPPTFGTFAFAPPAQAYL